MKCKHFYISIIPKSEYLDKYVKPLMNPLQFHFIQTALVFYPFYEIFSFGTEFFCCLHVIAEKIQY